MGSTSFASDLRWGAVCLTAVPLLAVMACSPTVRVEGPREPITINLNVKIDADVRVKLEEQADEDIRKQDDIF